jgi:hypothetical protein
MDGFPLGRAAAHAIAVFVEVDAHDPIPLVAELEQAGFWVFGGIDPIDKDEEPLESLAEDPLPLGEVGDVFLVGPILEGAFGVLAAMSAAFDVDQQIRAFLAINDEIEAFQLCVGKQRLFGLVDGYVGSASAAKIGLESGFIVNGAITHIYGCLQTRRDSTERRKFR